MFENRRYLWWIVGPALVLVGIFWWAEFYTDWLWYRHDAYPAVFNLRVLSKLGLFLIGSLLVYLILRWNLVIAERSASGSEPLADSDLDPELRDWIRGIVTPLIRWLPPVVALLGGLGVAETWQRWILAVVGVSFDFADPIFARDAGFYVYRLGAWQQIFSSLSSLLWVVLALVIIYRVYLGQITLRDNEIVFSRSARGHILAVAAAMLLVRAVLQWLARYGTLLDQRLLFAGPGWSVDQVKIPGLTIAALSSMVAAGLCLYVRRPGRGARPAYYGVGAALALHLIGAGLFPALAQRLLVTPNELERERPYIEHNIQATRRAFAIDQVSEHGFPAVSQLSADDLTANQGTVDNIRIWDQGPLLRTYSQLQVIRQYYDIVDVDSDRYLIDGKLRQVLVSARELNHDKLDVKARSWVNEHIEYTHGFGLVISPANAVSSDGQPEFMSYDIPPKTIPELATEQPRIYFGEMILMPPEELPRSQAMLPQQQAMEREHQVSPDEQAERIRRRLNDMREPDENDYLLVGTTQDEFDYAETLGNEEIKHRTRYEGASGVPIHGLFRKLMYAIRLHSIELAMTPMLTRESRILMHRQVTRRVQRAAPFLRWDTDPYPVAANGRIHWICEGYTFTQSFPYARTHYVREMGPRGERWRAAWNYIRNSVKAVVDAYDGTVTLYITEPDDPLVQSWAKVFPGMMKPLEECPAELRAHFRYPMLLFKTQADMYRSYHMTNPNTFYAQEDLWQFAKEVDRDRERQAREQGRQARKSDLYQEMPPNYIVMSLPGEDRAEFMLIAPFTPYSARGRSDEASDRDNMIAWMAAICDPERYGKLVVFKFPKDTNIFGPLQVEARIDQDDEISQQLTLWDRTGSQVIRGKLLVVPIESALVYVQPLYLESETKGLPELKRVIVVYNDAVVMEPTLGAALARIFGDARRPTRPAPQPATPSADPAADKEAEPATDDAPPAPAGVDPKLLAAAQQAFEASEAALRGGDWSRYEAERQRLQTVLQQLSAGAPGS